MIFIILQWNFKISMILLILTWKFQIFMIFDWHFSILFFSDKNFFIRRIGSQEFFFVRGQWQFTAFCNVSRIEPATVAIVVWYHCATHILTLSQGIVCRTGNSAPSMSRLHMYIIIVHIYGIDHQKWITVQRKLLSFAIIYEVEPEPQLAISPPFRKGSSTFKN